jgi:hypothetical protein
VHNGLISDILHMRLKQRFECDHKMSALFKYNSLRKELVAGVNVKNTVTRGNHGCP